MAITFVAAGAIPTSSASIALVAPACQPGDMLLAAIGLRSAGAITAPSGWTVVGATGTTPTAVWYVKTATSGDSGATFTFSASSNLAGVIVAYRGATGVGVSASAVGTSGTVTSPSVTTTVAGQLVLEVFASTGAGSGSATIAAPATVRAVSPTFFGTANVGIGVSEQTQATAGATPPQTATAGNNTSMAATVITLKGNTPPNAPTLTAPANAATIDRNQPNIFALTASDSDTGDSTSKTYWRTRIRDIGAAWTTVTRTSPITTYEFPADYFVAGDYEWQAATKDAQGAPALDADLKWSTSSFFAAAVAPPAPPFTAPLNGATVGQNVDATWSTPDQDAYQFQVLDGGTTISDTGEVGGTSGATTRTVTLTFPTNNVTRTLKVRVKKSGLWSAWATISVTVSYTPPPTPAVATTPVPAEGALDITITNPAPGAGVPAAAYNNVWIDDRDGLGWVRKATLLATNTTWRYWSPRSGVDTLVKVETAGVNGTTSEGLAP